MEYQSINIKIDQTGKVFLEVEGVGGKKCLELTKDIEKILGEVLEKEYKPEFYDETKDDENYLTVGN